MTRGSGATGGAHLHVDARGPIDRHVNVVQHAVAVDIRLHVDRGIDFTSAPMAIAAGADVLVAGTATFRGGPDAYADKIRKLRGG